LKLHAQPQIALGKAVRLTREKKDLSKTTVAALGGFTPRFLSDVESGRTNPTWGNVRRIASAMSMSMAQLGKVAESVERQEANGSGVGRSEAQLSRDAV
jgi:transcriptional regulator with XRE-family HTH domain